MELDQRVRWCGPNGPRPENSLLHCAARIGNHQWPIQKPCKRRTKCLLEDRSPHLAGPRGSYIGESGCPRWSDESARIKMMWHRFKHGKNERGKGETQYFRLVWSINYRGCLVQFGSPYPSRYEYYRREGVFSQWLCLSSSSYVTQYCIKREIFQNVPPSMRFRGRRFWLAGQVRYPWRDQAYFLSQ